MGRWKQSGGPVKTFSFHHTNSVSDESPSASTNQGLCSACSTKISSPFTIHNGWGIITYTWDKGEESKEVPLPHVSSTRFFSLKRHSQTSNLPQLQQSKKHSASFRTWRASSCVLPNSGGVDANEAPTPLVPATAMNTTPTLTLTAGSESKGLSHAHATWLTSSCPDPQGLTGSPEKEGNLPWILAYISLPPRHWKITDYGQPPPFCKFLRVDKEVPAAITGAGVASWRSQDLVWLLHCVRFHGTWMGALWVYSLPRLQEQAAAGGGVGGMLIKGILTKRK